MASWHYKFFFSGYGLLPVALIITGMKTIIIIGIYLIVAAIWITNSLLAMKKQNKKSYRYIESTLIAGLCWPIIVAVLFTSSLIRLVSGLVKWPWSNKKEENSK